MKTDRIDEQPHRRWLFATAFLAVLLIGLWCRGAGLFRGLAAGYTYHSDEPKQIWALDMFMHGKYTWQTNNRAWIGYAFFLNHVDRWLLRASEWARTKEYPGASGRPPARTDDRLHLYYAARSLRVFYGMLVLLACYAAGRALGYSRGLALFLMLCLALAPLSVCVAHFATGDIGVNLFSGLVLLLVCKSTRSFSPIRAGAVGLLVAFSFASKYNGILVIMVPGFAWLAAVALRRYSPRQAVSSLLIMAAAFVLGLFVAMPQLATEWTRTWRDILSYISYLSVHRTDEAILQLPFAARATASLRDNTAPLLSALGWTPALLGLVGLAFAATRLARKARRDPHCATHIVPSVAVFLFPLVAVLVSLAGKYSTQPFHLAFIQMPLLLAAGWTLRRLLGSRIPRRRFLVACLMLLMLSELAVKAATEHFFWKREDVRYLCSVFAKQVFLAPRCKDRTRTQNDRTVIRHFRVENGNPTVFRNRAREISCKDGAFWNALGSVPLPTIPLEQEHHWLFMNGPTFPRNDRMFTVQPGRTAQKHIVLYEKPGLLHIGIRTGFLPTTLRINMGGTEEKIQMESDDQKVLSIRPRRYRHTPACRPGSRELWLVPLTCTADLGSADVQIMRGNRDLAYFRAFGGDHGSFFMPSANTIVNKDARKKLSTLRFFESREDFHCLLSEDGPSDYRLLPPGTGIPAGVFSLQIEVATMTDTAELEIALVDERGISTALDAGARFRWAQGHGRASCGFAKTFAPYHCNLRLVCRVGRVRILRWRLALVTKQIVEDLTLGTSGRWPKWLRPFPASISPSSGMAMPRITFGNIARVTALNWPIRITQGRPVRTALRAVPLALTYANVDDYVFLFRFESPHSTSHPCVHVPARYAFYNSGLELALELELPDNIEPGQCEVWLALLNTRTDREEAVHVGRREPRANTRRTAYRVGSLSVLPGPPAPAEGKQAPPKK